MNRSPDHAMPRELISERGKNRLAVRADAQTEAALLEVLESFCSGFAARDADGVVQLFAPDADVVMVTSEETDPLWLVFREQRWTPSASPSNPIESRLADLRT
jgi:hypothetical protein